MEKIIVSSIKISHHNRQIDGIFYQPKREGKYPIVIFSHGYNGHKSDFDYTARYLAERGICALSYTFCGGSTRDESGMLTTDMTLFTEIEDLQAVITYVKGLEQLDKDNIFTFGGSQGGLVTALTVDDMSEEIKGMILLYPAFCIADDWSKRFPNISDIPEEVELWGMKMGRDFFESIHGFDVFAHVGKYANSVLVMHGDQDPIVAMGYSERIAETYPKVRLEVFPGEGHGFTEEGTNRMTELLYEFLQESR
ncbi:MAG: alpha/beta hydrolase [Lachnospiraceae bacterium]|nr:alpha/beta hydrolase [Lachnospiraceae bacterium]